MLKNKTLTTLGAVGILSVGVVTGLVATTSAQSATTTTSTPSSSSNQMFGNRGFGHKMGMGMGKNGPNQDLIKAVTDGDYEKFKSLAASNESGKKLLEKIDSQDKFNKFTELEKLKQSTNADDKAKAKQIADELGLPQLGKGGRPDSAEMQKVGDAIKNKNYNDFKTAAANVKNGDLLKKIDTEEKFNKLVEAQSYRQKSMDIMNELGIKGEGHFFNY